MVRKTKTQKATTLIEIVITLGIFITSVLVLYKVYALSTTHIINGKLRASALALADERMEQIHNIPYNEIATADNTPAGALARDETITRGDTTYRILISVAFIDDPFDGVAPDDTLFADYKRVRVSVVWGAATDASVSATDAKYNSTYKLSRVALVSQFIPPGGMETTATGGILSVNVITGEGDAVQGALVSIYNAQTDVTTADTTDAAGNVTYVGATVCDECYQITVTKGDYETIGTEEKRNGTTQLYDPVYTHQSVTEGMLTTVAIVTDKISRFDLVSVDPLGQSIPDVAFDINGGRILGTDPNNDNEPVYVLDTSLTTDGAGSVTVRSDTDADGTVDTSDKASSAEYHVTLTESGYTFWKLVPGDDAYPTATLLTPDSDVDVDMVLLDDAADGVFVRVVDDTDAPIEGATVTLGSDTLPYNAEQMTDTYGYVYFPIDVAAPLVHNETYDLEVSATGYNTEDTTVTVDALTTETITLTT